MRKVPQFVRLLLVVGSSLSLAVVAFAESTGNSVGKTLIGEDNIYFSWGVMLLLGSILVTSVTAMVQSNIHINNKDAHLTSERWAMLQGKEECQSKHTELNTTLTSFHETLVAVKEDVSFIKGKLDK